MLLVPEEVMRLIQQKTDLQTSPLVKSMSSLNQQMNQTLTDPNVADDIKLKNHEQLFNRYMNLQEQRESYIPTMKLHMASITPQGSQQPQVSQQPQASQQTQETQPISNSEILTTVPKKFRSQAEGLLRWVKKTPEAVKWDDRGVVSLDGTPIQGSSISDLVNDVLRTRKGFSPAGRDDFTRVLAELNTPEDFIRNEGRRKLMALHKIKESLPPSTPSLPTLQPSPPGRPRKRPISPALQRRGLKGSPPGKKGLDWISYD